MLALIRELVPVLGLLLCFLIACHFYGVGFNQDFLLLSLLGPLIVWISHARSGLTQLMASAPGNFAQQAKSAHHRGFQVH